MNCRPIPLQPDLSVAAQISVEDIPALAAAGFRSLICNRPDAEEPGQPPLAALRAAAKEHGMAFEHVPVSGGAFPPASVADFARALDSLPGPVLAYCRTGTRCCVLWALTQVGKQPASALIETARVAGYDLSALRPQLESPGA